MKTEARSAGEAFEKMVQEKKLSRKINYDVMKDLIPSTLKTDAEQESSRVDNEVCDCELVKESLLFTI